MCYSKFSACSHILAGFCHDHLTNLSIISQMALFVVRKHQPMDHRHQAELDLQVGHQWQTTH